MNKDDGTRHKKLLRQNIRVSKLIYLREFKQTLKFGIKNKEI